jgi:hypothetical protein
MEPFPTDVSSKTDLGMLKMSIAEMIGIPPGQQDFFFQGRLLAGGDERTLESYEIPKSAELFVRRNRDGNDDFLAGASAAEESCASRRRNAGPEVGFAGTGLSSGLGPRKSPVAPPSTAAAAAAASTTAAAAGLGSPARGARASPSPPAAAAAAVSAASAAAPASPGVWACKMCTLENQGESVACEVCGTLRS